MKEKMLFQAVKMNQDIYDDFATHLVSCWSQRFEHNYKVTRHRAWNRWRQVCTSQEKARWYCNSLKQAADHYSWTGDDASGEFASLSAKLQSAMNRNDEMAAALVCQRIFQWGGVAGGQNNASRRWVIAHMESGQLCKRLSDASELLKNADADLGRFNGRDLIMNSAMTKVYAACDPGRLVIYDGRVGAALGLLAKDHLRSIGHLGPVPEFLAYRWGSSRKKLPAGRQSERNPSEGDLKFRRLFGSNRYQVHAHMMRNASLLLSKVASLIENGGSSVLPRLEQALFMIGYDVSR